MPWVALKLHQQSRSPESMPRDRLTRLRCRERCGGMHLAALGKAGCSPPGAQATAKGGQASPGLGAHTERGGTTSGARRRVLEDDVAVGREPAVKRAGKA